MKNLLIYINPESFDTENQKLTKIQIDNSLSLGWSKEDIIIITNFPYEYREIKSTIIDNNTYCPFYKEASKIFAILYMFAAGLISQDLYWFHDLDAYQLEPITETELGLTNLDAGFTDYGRKPTWNTGSFFFKNSAQDIFKAIAERIKPGLNKQGHRQNEEEALMDLTTNNIGNINARIKRLNHTYNFGMRRVDLCYEKAIKPLKVLHFHPKSPVLNTLAIAMYGKNRLKKPLMNQRLIRLFNKYGYS